VNQRELNQLLARLEPELRRAFEAAIRQITSAAQIELVAGHIRAGNIEAAMAALRIDPRFFGPLDRAIADAYIAGGVAALASLPRLRDPFPDRGSCSASTPARPAPSDGPETPRRD
jgi:hypothetical protein